MHNFIDAYSWINLRYLLQGLGVTLEVSIVSIFFSFILGVILGLARYVKIKYFSAIVGFVIDVIRNLPLLLILFFTYFALPDIGIRLNVVAAAIIAMSIFESAMLAEIVRSGINAVPRGQMEAARSNGLTFYQAMRYIIMPQALKKMIPPIVSQFISLVKDTSLANTIANKEIIMMAKEYSAKGLIWPLFSTALFFLVFVGALTLLFGWAEKKLDYFR